jgi:processive 1,2-diacylglycerol beta-glucosyltransferase
MKPDAVVCTHFMPLERLSTEARHGRFHAPLYGVVTDFAVHSLWIVDRVSAYYVANEESRRHLIRHGQAPENVVVTGIPIDPAFAGRTPPEVARRRLGLDHRLPAVLILSGGFGVGPTVELIAAFSEAGAPCQLVVVAGANETLWKEAEAAAGSANRPVKVFGFVNNIHELMDAADVVITKPGGLTSSEVLAKGKPMIVIAPIPGQEQRNGEYLLEGGAALRLFDVHDAPYKVERLLSDPQRREEMQRKAAAMGRPTAGRDIVQDIIRRGRRPPAPPRRQERT